MLAPRRAWIAFIIVGMRLAAITPAAALTGTTGVWYVAPSGSDSNGCASAGAACATINSIMHKVGFLAGDSIRVAVGTYTGNGAEVALLNQDVTLSGGWNTAFTSQSGFSTIEGENLRRGITASGEITVTLDRFIVQHGHDTGNGGGGIRSADGNLTITNSIIRDNDSIFPALAARGGGIFIGAGRLNLLDSIVTGNAGHIGGGGILSGGSATITNSTISGNSVGRAGDSGGGGGGGIQSGLSLVVNNSTISGNTISGYFLGSGIEATSEVVINNSTISDNRGGAFGEGIHTFGGTVTLNNSTVVGNQHYGILNEAGTFRLRNTLIADNNGIDCYNDPSYFNGSIQSLGHNLVQNKTNCTLIDTDLTNVDPLVGLLRDNGGPTLTVALLAGSPAIGAGDLAACLLTDQRGLRRFARCDIGAYEYGATSLSIISAHNPSAHSEKVIVTATIWSNEPGTPTGTVEFRDATSLLGAASLDSTAHVMFPLPLLEAGIHTITATYSGDATFNGSISDPITQTVNYQLLLPPVMR